LLLHLIYERAQPVHIGHEYGQTNAVRKAGTFGFGDQLHIHETLPDASFVTFDEPVIRWIDATHACNEYKIARACSDAPGAGRRNRTLRHEDANTAGQGVPV
jgi:hypothetical protein